MICIDDSGWGNPLGGVLIGVIKRSGKKSAEHFGLVGLEFFQGERWERAEYKQEALRIVLEGLQTLNTTRTEKITLCRSPLFDAVEDWFKAKGANFIMDEVRGEAQKRMEAESAAYLKSIGLPVRGTTGHGGMSFNRAVDWVKSDPMDRLPLVKTGWGSLRNKWFKREIAEFEAAQGGV